MMLFSVSGAAKLCIKCADLPNEGQKGFAEAAAAPLTEHRYGGVFKEVKRHLNPMFFFASLSSKLLPKDCSLMSCSVTRWKELLLRPFC